VYTRGRKTQHTNTCWTPLYTKKHNTIIRVGHHYTQKTQHTNTCWTPLFTKNTNNVNNT
jgi:hypothetical protein